MPISREEFEKGAVDPGLALLEFLRSNPELAFTLSELRDALSDSGINMEEEHLGSLIEELQKRGTIESKTVGGVVYYIYRKPRMGFRPS